MVENKAYCTILGNGSSNGNESPSENDRKRGRHLPEAKTFSGVSYSTTVIVKTGPLFDFLIANQGVRIPFLVVPFPIDWLKAKHMLKELRLITSLSSQEFKVDGPSDENDDQISFKKRIAMECVEKYTEEIVVCDYFKNHDSMKSTFASGLLCINVGKSQRPTYVLIELCSLVPLQRYTKALTTLQRSPLVEKLRQKLHEGMGVFSEGLKPNHYDADRMQQALDLTMSSGVSSLWAPRAAARVRNAIKNRAPQEDLLSLG